MKNKKLLGHEFLKKLGKTKLRPGGIKATNFLLSNIDFNSDKIKILEIACNRGINLINLALKYENIEFIGIDIDKKSIDEALKIAKIRKIKNVSFFVANATKLPFDNNSIDYVINEAMLTMMPNNIKSKVILEVYRVLKNNGLYLTHDIMILNNKNIVEEKLSKAVNMRVFPQLKDEWIDLFNEKGFVLEKLQFDKFQLLNPIGMICDEGLLNTLKIIFNGLKIENREQFLLMKNTFNSLKNDINYIAMVNKKI